MTTPDQIGCPSCGTILNAKAAGCADPWHSDNELGVVNLDDLHEVKFAERFKAAMAQPQRITVLPPSESEREQAAYERGVAAGRRQATDGWTRRWSVRYPDGFVLGSGFTEAGARQRAADTGGTFVTRVVGPWEDVEQGGGDRGC